jgi:hypothetical protein
MVLMNVDFTSNEIEVEMLSGPHYPAMHLAVDELVPRSHEFPGLDYIVPSMSASDQRQWFTKFCSLPFGMNENSRKGLREVCVNHIGSIIEQEQHIGEATEGDISIISWKVFEAVNRYRRSSCENRNVSQSSQTSLCRS